MGPMASLTEVQSLLDVMLVLMMVLPSNSEQLGMEWDMTS